MQRKTHLGYALPTEASWTGKDTSGDAWCRIVANLFSRLANAVSHNCFLKSSLYQHLGWIWQEANRYFVSNCCRKYKYGPVLAYLSIWQNRVAGPRISLQRKTHPGYALPTGASWTGKETSGDAWRRIVANLFSKFASLRSHNRCFESSLYQHPRRMWQEGNRFFV